MKNLEEIIEEVLPYEVDSVVKYLSSLEFNDIDDKYYVGLDNTISSLMGINKFEEKIEEKINILQELIRNKLVEV